MRNSSSLSLFSDLQDNFVSFFYLFRSQNQKNVAPSTDQNVADTAVDVPNSFSFEIDTLSENEHRYRLVDEKGQAISYEKFLNLLEKDDQFREQYISTLKKSPFKAYFWECPAVNQKTMGTQPFEFVLTRSKALEKVSKANSAPFADHLSDDKGATHFYNLRKDGVLICPNTCNGSADPYQSLASFTKNAPMDQQHKLWKKVAEQAKKAVEEKGDKPTWLSTHGLGVNWLHVRLDSTPKYYHHAAYRQLKQAPSLRMK